MQGRWDGAHRTVYAKLASDNETANLVGPCTERLPRGHSRAERMPAQDHSHLRASVKRTSVQKTMPCCPGGSHAVASAMGWRTQRRRRHGSTSLDEAAQLVKAYLEGLPRGSPARGRMPSHREVMECGRHDVRYAMQVHNHPYLHTWLI